MLGASESVALKSNWDRGDEFGIYLYDLAAMADKRLNLRCLLPVPPGYKAGIESQEPRPGKPWERTMRFLRHLVSDLGGMGWIVRMVPETRMPVSSLVIDSSVAICYEYLNDDPGPVLHVGGQEVEHYVDRFENYWLQSVDISQVEPLYEASLESLPKNHIAEIVLHSAAAWDELLLILSRSPEYLYSVSPRRFEEIIAELLSRSGLEVLLTPSSRDGGRDILCFNDTPVGRHLYLVECKRHRSDRPVGVGIVRQLYGVIAQERATAGIIVTTSFFTKHALNFRDSIRHQMSLRDFDQLKSWLLASATRKK